MNFTISTESVAPDHMLVHAVGELDMASARRLRDNLLSAVAEGSVSTVTVDLSAVTFIDSSGIGALIAALTAAERAGRTFTVEHATAPVLRVLQMVGIAAPLGLPASAEY